VLLGTPDGFQSPLVLQVPLPAMFQVEGLVNVHWAYAAAAKKKSTTAGAKKAQERRGEGTGYLQCSDTHSK
jgi:hypothetical protein